MTSVGYDEKDNSSEERGYLTKPIIKNGPALTEVNGKEYDDSFLHMDENAPVEELQRNYNNLLSEFEKQRSRVDELTNENESFQQRLRDIGGGAFVDVQEVNDLRQMVMDRLRQVRKCIEKESAEKSRLFSELQQAVIDKDNALTNFREFQSATKKQLLELQASLNDTPAPADDGVSRHLHEQLRQKYHESEERRAASELRVTQREKELRQLSNEKERIEKDKQATVKKLTKKLQNEKNRMTNEKRELEEKCRTAEIQAQEAKSSQTELENENRRLQRDLTIKTEEYDQLAAEDRSQQQESNKKLMEKERTIERQIQVERELRYELEQKMNGLIEEKSQIENEMTTYKTKCEKMEADLERTKTAHDDKDRELTIGSKKLDEIRQHERQMEAEKSEAENRARELEQRCQNMSNQISDMQKAMQKKVNQEKALKAKQKQVREREKELLSQEKRMENKYNVQQVSSGNPRQGKGGKKALKPLKSRDPLFQYRNLLPWPWMVLGLLVLLFFSVMARGQR